jgi:hypothetical protein
MALVPEDILDRKVVQHLRTSGSNEYVVSSLSGKAAIGEIIVQLSEELSGTSLWTLAKDGEHAVQFVNKDVVSSMITSGVAPELVTIKDSVGLNPDGSIVKDGESVWGSATTFFDSASTIVDAVKDLDEEIAALKISGVTPTDPNVKEEYALMDADGAPIGDTIKVYKDSALVRFYLGLTDDVLTNEDPETHESPDSGVTPGTTGSTALVYIMQLADGNYALVAIDVESFLQESEFKSGVTVTDHIVHGVVDPASEEFLTVGADGFKLSGVQDAIDDEAHRAMSAETALDAVVGAVKAESGESRTYAHSGTNYLDNNSNVKADAESIDSLLGKVENTPADSADTVFSSVNSVAKNISDIKKDLAAFKNKLNLVGLENAYEKVTVVSAETGTTIEVSAKTQDIATSTSATTGLADAFDVRQFAVSDVDSTSLDTSAGVVTKATASGDKVLDFTNIKIDCGEF